MARAITSVARVDATLTLRSSRDLQVLLRVAPRAFRSPLGEAIAMLVAVLGTLAAEASGNLNGRYTVTSVDKLGVPFNDDYASKGHEYFDVWAPEIASTYGMNFWTSQGVHPIPDHIIQRFKVRRYRNPCLPGPGCVIQMFC